LMLQEALVRGAVKFEYDAILGSEVAVAIVDAAGTEIVDLREEWLPRYIYGDSEYERRVNDLKVRRYYGRNSEDKAGILRYTKVANHIYDFDDIPLPSDERQLAWLLSFYWGVDVPQNDMAALGYVTNQGSDPGPEVKDQLTALLKQAQAAGLHVEPTWTSKLRSLGIELG